MKHARLIRFVVGPIRIVEGLAMLLSTGLYYPNWELRFLFWNHDREMRHKAKT